MNHMQNVMALLAVGLPLATNADAADSPSEHSAPPSRMAPSLLDEELDEVEVTGLQPRGNRDDIVIWLRRLVGRFSSEGTLERGDATVLPATGLMDCLGVGNGPGVNCVIKLYAPGIQTNLNPGSFLLGVDLETPTVRYTSVDDTGVAVGTTGELRGDTAIFRTPCEAGSVRTCVSTTRISADRHKESVRFRVEIKMDGRVIARYDVTQVRIKMP